MIDPNEAPEGYLAEEKVRNLRGESTCNGCDLLSSPECLDSPCTSTTRFDGRTVIFKRIGPVMAIYATPCDDMGAHVADDEVTA